MSYTLSDIRTKVRNRVRDSAYDSTEITNYLNDAQNDVFNEYRLPFMEATQDYTLATGTADISNGSGLPTNFVQPISLILTSSGKERVIPIYDVREMDVMFPDYENNTSLPSGEPQAAYKYGQTIKVYPEPDQAYTVTLRYYKRPTLLSADADIPSLPSEFEEMMVVGASYRVLQVKDNYDQAAILENKYKELLDKLVMKYTRNQTGQPTIMRINRNVMAKRHY